VRSAREGRRSVGARLQRYDLRWIPIINNAHATSVSSAYPIGTADPGKIRQALTEYNLLSEEWGGETIFCEVSAKKKQGIEEMLEMILLQADAGTQGRPDPPARGVVIEAKGSWPGCNSPHPEGTLREGMPSSLRPNSAGSGR
jgi:hypothetical protein